MGASVLHELMAYVVAPLIALAGIIVPVVIQIRKARSENRDQHEVTARELGRLAGAVEAMTDSVQDVGHRLDAHIDHHNDYKRGAA